MFDNLLIHIGYHKTATTWLQRELFISNNNVFEPLSMKDNGKSKLVSSFIKGKDGYILPWYCNNDDLVKRQLLQIVKYKNLLRGSKTLVLSGEQLSGNPHSSGLDTPVIAKRLKKVFPSARILIIIREQKTFLLSNYFQYLNAGGVHNLQKYLNLEYDMKRPFFSPHHINYLPLVEMYMKLFSPKNVLVLPYELFKESPRQFINQIGDFVGKKIEINESRFNVFINRKTNHYVNYHLRFLNYFLKSNSLNDYSSFNRRFTKRTALKFLAFLYYLTPNRLNQKILENLREYIEEWVGNRYQKDNKELSKIIEMDLEEFGYY